MKFSEFIKEEIATTLIGMTINGELVTPETSHHIWHGDFDCRAHTLKSLNGAPKIVKGAFNCGGNMLTSLEGVPKQIDGIFDCSYNKLTNLKDIHKMITKIGGSIFCHKNPIQSHVLGLLLIPGIRRIFSFDAWAPILNKHLGTGRKGMLNCQNDLIEVGLEEYAQL